jgi:hypothetical protein
MGREWIGSMNGGVFFDCTDRRTGNGACIPRRSGLYFSEGTIQCSSA